jgi:Protein of unknown function (DUF551)
MASDAELEALLQQWVAGITADIDATAQQVHDIYDGDQRQQMISAAAGLVAQVALTGIERLPGLLSAALSSAAPARETWQPIETLPESRHNEQMLFWVIPKPPEECPRDTSGNSIFGGGQPHIEMIKFRCWSSLSKATHWMPLPSPPESAR